MLILGGTGFGVMMWVDPVFRQKTVDWGKTRFAKLHAYATAEDMKGPQAGSAPSPTPASERGAKRASDLPTRPRRPREPAAESKTPALVVEEPKAPAEPEARPPRPRRLRPLPPFPRPRQRRPHRRRALPRKRPRPSPARRLRRPTVPPRRRRPKRKSRSPRRSKSSSRASSSSTSRAARPKFKNPPDYPAAFKAYSAIKKLPAEVWPSDLDYRITTVQKKLK
jgi:hypothetical protein